MKKIVLISALLLTFSCTKKDENSVIAEVSCGQCQFDLHTQDGCDLAIRLDVSRSQMSEIQLKAR